MTRLQISNYGEYCMTNYESMLPQVRFAHKISVDDYSGSIRQKEGHFEIAVITDGELHIRRGSRNCTVKKNEVLLLDDSSDVIYLETPEPHSHHTVSMLVNSDLYAIIHSFSHVLTLKDPFNVCLNLIDKIIRNYVIEGENSFKLSGLCLQLIGEIMELYKIDQQICTPSEKRYIEYAKKYIYDHISEPILQKDIANYLNITPEYLCSVFKKVEGCSVIRFINETKLTQIRLLMANTQCSLGQAVAQYGFSDPNYVSKLYKKYYFESITQSIRKLK